MTKKILQHKYQIAIILAIFILYLFTGIGVLDISFYSGIDINFNTRILVSTISNTFIQPFSQDSLNLLLMLVTGLLLSVCLPLLSPIYAAMITLLSCIPHIYINLSNTESQLILPMEYNLLIIMMLFSINALIIYFIETHSRLKIVNLFGQFVPPEIVSEICRVPDSIKLDGESRQMTVFFCDLQDFTSIAELLEPIQVTLLLNEYFDAMTEILYRYGATIDKYIGDAIMAFWNAPLVQIDHAQRAVLAALEMHEKMKPLSENLLHKGLPAPPMGIGINTGMMNVGNMGSKYRVTYTVIGDAVNLASRVETLTRRYRVPILVSETTKNECNDVAFREIDIVQVKGKQNFTKIYQPVCKQSDLTEKMKDRLKLHQHAFECFTNRDFNSAVTNFSELRETCGVDEYYPVILEIINGRKHSIKN